MGRRLTKIASESADVMSMLRRLRESIGQIEDLEPGQEKLRRDYQHMLGWAIIELRRIRAGLELDLLRRGISARERKATAERLNLITLLQSEFEATEDHPGH
jgi:hypothetical protein